MKLNKKSLCIIVTAFGFVLVLIGGILLFVNRDEKTPVVDNDDQQQDNLPVVPKDENEIFASEDKKVNQDVEVSNFKYSKQERGYLISFDVVNNSKINYENLVIMFVFYDSNQQFLYSFDFHSGKFKSGESKSFENQSYGVFEEVADYEIYILQF